MTDSQPPRVPHGYRIRVAGRLDDRWATWFDGFTLTVGTDGTTSLCGGVADQAQLHGLLTKVRDLGLDVVSLEPIDLADGSGPAARSTCADGS
jgi:hypothetical protein